MERREVIVIGGGLSGIMAARTLMEKGVTDILIVEKGRSVGGRLATRRIGNGKADHGAQFFTVRSHELQHDTEKWLEAGWVKKWFGTPYPRYTSVNGMNGLAKHLAQPLPVRLNTKVTAIRDGDGPLEVEIEDGRVMSAEHCIVTVPAPQASSLLAEIGDASTVSFAPCFVGMFTFDGASSIPAPGHLDGELPDGVERVADHFQKGISDTVTVGVYMTGGWSQENERRTDQDILASIQTVAERYLEDGSRVSGAELKRWTYAEAKSVVNKPFIETGGARRILLCGDAFLRENDQAGRTRFESAYLSGISAGERVARKLKGNDPSA
ncbi:NAD(P)/FAD-dependent oxidoreductase [Bacillus sp. KH172YL63]|uniref:NAD(P)/FAD-dependent oxidoreductase n=1 Tax=Bacillus sp. KH172YL63 TaxID=2709784 RepID=UPI0013E41BC2|nr:FAD-dependent oxidoreductase [Bacillus sp. KH172YL63]BCB02422.1 hypothetical protein KH172YL63_05550 [Bacillus sp. KH172YL63]